ncbi:MAG: hypothetical protein LUH49_04055 [Cloacibacillus porcorum]|nr:hypothetical protein [Cloacibacillus porcorum]MCD7876135.1 hypothetical protein [Cloacibacillus porcorum]
MSVEFGFVKVSAPPEFFVSCPVVTGGSAVFIVVGGDLDGFTFGGGTAAIVIEFAGFGGQFAGGDGRDGPRYCFAVGFGYFPVFFGAFGAVRVVGSFEVCPTRKAVGVSIAVDYLVVTVVVSALGGADGTTLFADYCGFFVCRCYQSFL